MEWLFIFGLAGVVAYLWNRLDAAERRLEMIDRVQEHTALMLHDLQRRGLAPVQEESVGETDTEVPRAVSVPAIAKLRDEERLAARVVYADQPTPSVPVEPDEPTPEAPEPEPTLAERLAARATFDFEDIFGRRLPIWAGGVALAIAGVFLVRYAIEAGLLTPLVRVIFSFLFGLALLSGAEAAYRFKERVADPRVAQALAGAGLATLYAGFYLAGTQYGLIGQTFAFAGLAVVTAAAIGLSFRFGLPSAVLGLVGGFAAPALVGSEEANLPLLSLYLGLVTAGLTLTGKQQGRPWLGIAALAGGLGWGALLLLAGEPGTAEILSLGLYFVVLGTVIPALLGGERFEQPLRLGSAVVASVQLALLVAQAGFAPLAWGLYLLMGGALAFFGWQRPALREANVIGAIVGLLLFARWDMPPAAEFAAVGTALALVFAAIPLVHIWRRAERSIDLWQLCGTALILAAVAYGHFGHFGEDRFEPVMALVAAALAVLPALAAWRMWPREGSAACVLPLASAAILAFAALLMVTQAWLAPVMAAAVFACLFALLHKGEDHPATALLWASAAVTGLSLFGVFSVQQEFERLVGMPEHAFHLASALRWLAAAAPFAALAWRDDSSPLRRIAEAVAAILLYAALAQVLPGDVLAWTAALLAIGCFVLLRDRHAAQLTLATIAALWALVPFGEWATAALASLGGDPVFVGDVPGWRDIALRILPPLAAFVGIRFPEPVSEGGKSLSLDSRWLAAPFALVAVHALFKQGFAIETMTAFASYGLAERTLWEALLLVGAWLAARGMPYLGQNRRVAIVLAGAVLAHFAIYTLFWHNPLFARQAVGPVPLANLALAAYAVPVAATLLLRQWVESRLRPVADGLVIALVSLCAITLLRQVFAGTILVDRAMTQSEDLLRSLLGIVLAIGFLALGSWRGERSWRVGSLVLMLLAVGKVFLLDAAGLEGLLRIASFMALGFSLIGIGWLYARQLKLAPRGPASQ